MIQRSLQGSKSKGKVSEVAIGGHHVADHVSCRGCARGGPAVRRYCELRIVEACTPRC